MPERPRPRFANWMPLVELLSGFAEEISTTKVTYFRVHEMESEVFKLSMETLYGPDAWKARNRAVLNGELR